LIAGLKTDPIEAERRLNILLKHPKSAVRAWACIVGAKACGRMFVPTLLNAFSDPSQEVQEAVLSGLQAIDPSIELLRPLQLQMRQRLLKWDGDGAPTLAHLLTRLNDIDSVPYFARYLERKDVDRYAHQRGEVYFLYLSEGIAGVFNRIRSHKDHALMAILCDVAYYVGAPEAEAALEQLLEAAPDERCRIIARQTLDALAAARAAGPPPYWNRRLTFKSLPRV
jgi:hypothetical protein